MRLGLSSKQLTLLGSTRNMDSKAAKIIATSHSFDFSPPHSKLYRTVKKPEAATLRNTRNHPKYKHQCGSNIRPETWRRQQHPPEQQPYWRSE